MRRRSAKPFWSSSPESAAFKPSRSGASQERRLATRATRGWSDTSGAPPVVYEQRKFEQDRRQIYIIYLAVCATHQGKRVATTLVGELKRAKRRRGDPPVRIGWQKANRAHQFDNLVD